MYRVLPELVWCGFGVLLMLMQPFVRSRQFFTFLALIGTLAGTAASRERGHACGARIWRPGGVGQL